MEAVTSKVERAKAELVTLNTKIEATLTGRKQVSGKVEAANAAFQALRTESTRIKAELTALQGARDEARARLTKLSADAKEQRSKVKFGSFDEIDARLKALELKQETSTMSLREEKELVREIETVRAQRNALGAANDAVTKAASERETADTSSKDIMETIIALRNSYGEAIGRTNAAYEAWQALMTQRKPKDDTIDVMMKERDATRAAITKGYADKNALHEAYQAEWTAYKEHLGQVREKEREEREARAAQAIAAAAEAAATGGEVSPAIAADLAAFHPNAKKIEEVERLSAYLASLLPKTAEAAKPKAASAAQIEGPDGKPLRIGPKEDDDDDLSSMVKTKKGKAGGARPAAAPVNARLVHDLSIMAQLQSHGVPMPCLTNDIPAALEALAAKKAGYEASPAAAAV